MIAPMGNLPQYLYRASDVRELDRIAIEDYRIAGITLMKRAGYAAFQRLRNYWPNCKRIAIACGTGNNGGDGLVLAYLLRNAGFDVAVGLIGERQRMHGDALTAAGDFTARGASIGDFFDLDLESAELIVDALLGTGIDRAVTGRWCRAIEMINHSDAPVLSIDIPSGLNADSGCIMGASVVADVTVTFIGVKQGLLTGDGPDCSGVVEFDDLQVPDAIYQSVAPSARRFDEGLLERYLGRRRRSSHKGEFGHVLVVGGDRGMSGAARMAGEAALRTGAGLVSIATRPDHLVALNSGRPELMCHGVETAAQLNTLLERASVVAIGPGLGRSSWAQHLLGTVLESALPLIVDADALNLLAAEPLHRSNWILTPHPGEAGRMLACSTATVQNDRFSAARQLVDQFGGVCVLKGHGTLVASVEGPVTICETGNPGMASGGMGDVLTGVVAGLVAQKIPIGDAARLGVWLHGRSGDGAAVDGERGLCATDLFPHLHKLVNPVQR